MFQSRMDLSTLPLARVAPSRLNLTENTVSVWPVSGGPSWRWVATSHSPTELSALPLATVAPSRLNLTENTVSVWPVSGGPSWRWVGDRRDQLADLPLINRSVSSIVATCIRSMPAGLLPA
jgi:hypothetical protein